MKLVVLVISSVLFAVCYSQTPKAPDIPETFSANVEVELHVDETYFGSGIIARDQSKGWGVEDIWIIQDGHNVSQLRLERYDMGMVFLLRSVDRRCEVRKVNGTLPPYFGWMSCSDYTGQINIRGYLYDSWTLPGPGGSFTLLVDPEEPNVPRFVNAEIGTTTRNLLFRDFMPATPSPDLFTVPPECQE